MSNIGKTFTTTKGEEIAVKECPVGREDLTGRVFGERTVLGFAYVKGKLSCWVVRCSCGNVDVVRGNTLKEGKGHMCSACAAKKIGEGRREDLTGRVFGERTVLGFAGSKIGASMWKVQCSCGKIDVIHKGTLILGRGLMCKACSDKKVKEGLSEDIIIKDGDRYFSNHYISRIVNQNVNQVSARLKQYFSDVTPVNILSKRVAGYYMTEEKTRKILSVLRTRTPEAQALLEELSGAIVDDSTEGVLFKRVEKNLLCIKHFHGADLTIKRDIKEWSFFIPEVKLYIGFEQGKNVKGVNTMIVCNKVEVDVNARIIEEKIKYLLSKKN